MNEQLFTQDEIKTLYEPFPLAAHSIREGYKNKAKTRVRWFVYLDRIAIQRRLDELFPGQWEFSVNEIYRNTNYVNITATLTIRGVSRSFNGGQSEPSNSKSDPENLEKGAMTDTFRRCASLWGFGAYISDGIDIYTAGYADDNWNEKTARETEAKRQFQEWYVAQYESTSPPIDNPPRTSKRIPTDHVESTGNGKPKTEPAVQYNLSEVMSRTAFMYDHPNHHANSIPAMIEVGEIEPGYSTETAIAKVMMHRALSKPYNMPSLKVYNALTAAMEAEGSNVPVASVSQWIKDGKTIEQAWEAIVAYHENANLPPAQPVTAPIAGDEIPL